MGGIGGFFKKIGDFADDALGFDPNGGGMTGIYDAVGMATVGAPVGSIGSAGVNISRGDIGGALNAGMRGAMNATPFMGLGGANQGILQNLAGMGLKNGMQGALGGILGDSMAGQMAMQTMLSPDIAGAYGLGDDKQQSDNEQQDNTQNMIASWLNPDTGEIIPMGNVNNKKKNNSSSFFGGFNG